MARNYALHKCLQFGLFGLVAWLSVSLFTAKAQAQPSNIVPDNTLGTESSQVSNFQGRPIEVITGGAIRQINLFHSLREFNVSAGRGAYFFIPNVDIQNVLARVTGANRSEILGTLGTYQVINGNIAGSNANLFLINPNGIIFGRNASLDLQGSFVGTTANGVQFGNQGNFSATNPQPVPLLTINPSALLFSQQQSRAIAANQSRLSVAPGKNLTLVGGDIGLNSSTLEAFGGRIELAAVAGTGTVGINADSSLSLPDNLARANINISNSLIDVSDYNGGSIAINAGNLDISRSTILAGIYYGLGTVNSQAGDITINTTGKLQIAPQTFIQNLVFPNAIGKGGNIRINTDSMSVTDASIATSTVGKGNAGSVVINAKNDIALNDADIFSLVETTNGGNAGNIDITARNLFLTRGAWLSASTLGKGNAGDVNINVSDRISVDGANSSLRPSAIRSIIVKDAVGKGGNIRINTGSLSITNSGKIDTSVFGTGDAGDVTINARDTVSLDGVTQRVINSSAIFTTVEDEGIGNAGNISINTGSLFLTNGGGLISRTENQGNAGNITVQARDSVIVDGGAVRNVTDRGAGSLLIEGSRSEITSSVEKNARGNAGNILISAGNNISLNPDSKVVIGVSPDGVNNINNIDTTLLSKFFGGVRIKASTDGEGNAGTITINAGKQLLMNNEAELRTTTNGKGNAGNITVKAGDRISLDNDSVIVSWVDNQGIGKGGDIRISTGSLSIAGAAQLDTTTFGEGDAGNVIIDARDAVLFTGGKPELNVYSGILSTAERQGKGNGGNIRISADSVVVADGATLSTITTKQGNAGNIDIQARNQVRLINEGEIKTATYAQGNAGNISVNAVNQVNLDKNSIISTEVGRNATGNGGTISIEAESLSVTNDSQLLTYTFGRGNAGNVTINSRGDVSLSGIEFQEQSLSSTGISSGVASTGIGNAGDIRINARNLFMRDNASLEASTLGQGNSGNIFINASDRVSLDSRAIISNIVGASLNPGKFGDGKGGTIRIDTGTLSMLNGAQLQASTFGRGDAGDVIINARDSFLASGFGQFEDFIGLTAIFSIVADDSRGNGGNIRVNTGSLFVEDGARFSVSTSGLGRAGNISINARDAVVVDGINEVGFASRLSTATNDDAGGQGGTITVNTNSFRLSNGALVDAQTNSAFRGGDVTINANNFAAIQGGRIITTATNQGQAGNITLNAENINLSGSNQRNTSGLFANTTSTASGRGGNIQINAKQLNMSDRAQVSVNSQGSGVAGNIDVKADTVKLSDRANIIAETASQDGGSININAADLLLLRGGSTISTTAGTAQAKGNGGNININAKFIVAVPNENSDISANAFLGNGGNIAINSQGIFGIEARPKPTEKSDITASSELGLSGVININTPDTSSIQSSFAQIFPVIDTNKLIAQSCIARGNKKQENSFFITGSGALNPNRPYGSLSTYTTGEVRGVETASRPWKKGDPIIEATGVYFLDDGRILFSRECDS